MLLNNNNFHLFVIITSLLHYFFMKRYRLQKSNFLFFLNIIYLPFVLYTFAYINSTTNFFKLTGDVSSDLSMYPSSIDV